MNLKTSAIALAVAGAVAAPVAVQADSGFYGSVRIGFQFLDQGTLLPKTVNTTLAAPASPVLTNTTTQATKTSTATGVTSSDSEITIRGYAARFGFRGETDMGNGLTGYGRYEWAVGTEGASANVTRRHAYVGVKGDFGNIFLGQTYHTYYNFISGPVDNPWWGAGVTMLAYTGRTAQAITYAGGSGTFGFGATLYMDDSSTDAAGSSNDLDKYEIAANWQAGPILLALGVSDQDEVAGVDPEPVIGLTASGWETGIFTWGLNYAMQDGITGSTGDASSIVLDVGIANGYVHYELLDMTGIGGSADQTQSTITLGYTQSLGRQTTMWYEYQVTDYDLASQGVTAGGEYDLSVARAVLKYDWK